MNAYELEQYILSFANSDSTLNPEKEAQLRDIPIDVIREYQLIRVNHLLEQALESPFWLSKTGGLTMLSELDQLSRIPPTLRDEIDTLYIKGKWSEMLTVNEDELPHRTTSGGTSHKAPFVSALSQSEYNWRVADIMRVLFHNGVMPGDRMVIGFPGNRVFPPWVSALITDMGHDIKEYITSHVSGTTFYDAGLRIGLDVVATGLPILAFKKSPSVAQAETERMLAILDKTYPKVLATSPNLLDNAILPGLDSRNQCLCDIGIEIIVLGGAMVSPQKVAHLQAQGVHVAVWLESGEMGTIAYSHGKNLWGLLPNHFSTLIEVVDRYGKPVPPGDRGRLLGTRLLTTGQLLIRYDLEDECAFFVRDGLPVFDWNYTKSSDVIEFPSSGSTGLAEQIGIEK